MIATINTMTDSSDILIQVTAGVAEITLNRPSRMNSFTASMHSILHSRLSELQADPHCRAILLTGAGDAFCTGQDLNDRDPRKLSGKPDLHHSLTTQFNPLVTLLRSINQPVVCAVNGVAAGAGANLALACDIVLAADNASFIQSFAKVGLLPDAGGSWVLPRLVGEARAKAIAMTGQPVSAKQAQDWGMIWRMVAAGSLMSEARALATSLADGPVLGTAATKKAIQQSYDHTFEEHLQHEAQWQGELGRSDDYAEGVVAFLEKRKAVFKGN